jgi:hypothetical protein
MTTFIRAHKCIKDAAMMFIVLGLVCLVVAIVLVVWLAGPWDGELL